jgi:hypothetical protein
MDDGEGSSLNNDHPMNDDDYGMGVHDDLRVYFMYTNLISDL